MDASTLTLHRALLRLSKGAVGAYEAWLKEQEAESAVASLKNRKAELSQEPLANGKRPS